MKAAVHESAVRELLREAMENVGALAYGPDRPLPVEPNAALDRTTLELDVDPIELRHLPRTRNELAVMVRRLLDDVPDDQSGEMYKKIRDAVAGGDKAGRGFGGASELTGKSNSRSDNSEDDDMGEKTYENKRLGDVVKAIVEAESTRRMNIGGTWVDDEEGDEEGPLSPEELGEPVGASHLEDPEFMKHVDDDEEDEEEEEEEEEEASEEEEEEASAWDPEPVAAAPKKGVKRNIGDAPEEFGGATLQAIANTFGFTQEAAKKAVDMTMERFRVLHEMDPEDRDELVLTGVSDYIDMLMKSGEVDDEEEALLRKHPRIVATSDEFREFFSKYVKRAVRDWRADTQDG